jgi:hypothetical protein
MGVVADPGIPFAIECDLRIPPAELRLVAFVGFVSARLITPAR